MGFLLSLFQLVVSQPIAEFVLKVLTKSRQRAFRLENKF